MRWRVLPLSAFNSLERQVFFLPPKIMHSLWKCNSLSTTSSVGAMYSVDDARFLFLLLTQLFFPFIFYFFFLILDYGLCCSTLGGCCCGPVCVGGLGHAFLRQRVASASGIQESWIGSCFAAHCCFACSSVQLYREGLETGNVENPAMNGQWCCATDFWCDESCCCRSCMTSCCEKTSCGDTDSCADNELVPDCYCDSTYHVVNSMSSLVLCPVAIVLLGVCVLCGADRD